MSSHEKRCQRGAHGIDYLCTCETIRLAVADAEPIIRADEREKSSQHLRGSSVDLRASVDRFR